VPGAWMGSRCWHGHSHNVERDVHLDERAVPPEFAAGRLHLGRHTSRAPPGRTGNLPGQ